MQKPGLIQKKSTEQAEWPWKLLSLPVWDADPAELQLLKKDPLNSHSLIIFFFANFLGVWVGLWEEAAWLSRAAGKPVSSEQSASPSPQSASLALVPSLPQARNGLKRGSQGKDRASLSLTSPRLGVQRPGCCKVPVCLLHITTATVSPKYKRYVEKMKHRCRSEPSMMNRSEQEARISRTGRPSQAWAQGPELSWKAVKPESNAILKNERPRDVSRHQHKGSEHAFNIHET